MKSCIAVKCERQQNKNYRGKKNRKNLHFAKGREDCKNLSVVIIQERLNELAYTSTIQYFNIIQSSDRRDSNNIYKVVSDVTESIRFGTQNI